MKEKLLKKIVQYFIWESGYEISLPKSYEALRELYVVFVTIREPKPIKDEVLKWEDAYLQLSLQEKKITDASKLDLIRPSIVLWQGDITTLKCDVIVNAGNHQGLGCFNPRHRCIDHMIHLNAGMRLRLECQSILQGREIPDGKMIVCDGYNLPCQKVITTVGPQIQGRVKEKDKKALAQCYQNALCYAIEHHYKSIVFPCISTGLFGYPIKEAKFVAYEAVLEVLAQYRTNITVIFDVFSKEDYDEYYELFQSQKVDL